MKRNVVNKPAKIQCQICDKEISGYGFTNHLKTHGVSTDEYVSKFGEYRKSKLKPIKEHKRKINRITCKICNKEYASVGMSGHLRDTHNMTTDEYIDIHGEFRPGYIRYKQKVDENKIVCLECNTIHGSERMLTFHLRMDHKMTRKEYTIKHVFNYEKQYCKCGCGQEVKILYSHPYRREYITGHNPNGMTGRHHSEESKLKMSKSAAKRILNNVGITSSTKIEIQFMDILNNNDIQYEHQVLADYGVIDFYLPDYDLYIEIDGIYWHPLEKENLNFQQITNSISEIKKYNKIENLRRISSVDLDSIKTLDDILSYNSKMNYNIKPDTIILASDYIKYYKTMVDDKKIYERITGLIKFMQLYFPDKFNNIDTTRIALEMLIDENKDLTFNNLYQLIE